MSPDPSRPFTVEPWVVREPRLDLASIGQAESVFALSNGHIGLRGNLDEGEPHVMPGTYLNSFYERRPLPYAEGGYGYPESGQTIINVTNGKIIRLLVDDEPFDIRYGTLHSHQRVLDLRAGTLTREVDWSSPAGARIPRPWPLATTGRARVSPRSRSSRARSWKARATCGGASTRRSRMARSSRTRCSWPRARRIACTCSVSSRRAGCMRRWVT